ncbi:MAG: hypothetical protein ORN49_00085 [Rhodobacteraceae bacterium]|nr:hypothetical protein [Paracoccaceae bacterium]
MTDPLIAEIVTFRTLPGHRPEAVARAAAGLAPFLATCPGFLSRSLSQAEDGTWTDHVLWSSLHAAKAAGERILSDPQAAPFMAMIDGPSVRLDHRTVMAHQTAKAA